MQYQPTIFIHGYAGTYFSFGKMIRRLVNKNVGDHPWIVLVSRTGKIHFLGKPHSLIQVIFLENRSTVDHQVEWLWQLLNKLRQRFGIKKVNFVAHSMGCVSLLKYLSQYGEDFRTADVSKVVMIGAPFNDHEVAKRTSQIENHPLTSSGPVEMAPFYRWIRENKIGLPAIIEFLNIAGNLQDGSDSDGQVAVNSALSLRYLVKDLEHHYHEFVVHGKRAQHSLLHENREVDEIITSFLTK